MLVFYVLRLGLLDYFLTFLLYFLLCLLMFSIRYHGWMDGVEIGWEFSFFEAMESMIQDCWITLTLALRFFTLLSYVILLVWYVFVTMRLNSWISRRFLFNSRWFTWNSDAHSWVIIIETEDCNWMHAEKSLSVLIGSTSTLCTLGQSLGGES